MEDTYAYPIEFHTSQRLGPSITKPVHFFAQNCPNISTNIFQVALNAARAFQLATSNVLPDRIVVNQSVPSRVNMLPNMCRHTFPSLDTLMQYVLYDKMSTMSDSMCYMPLICRFHPMIYFYTLASCLVKKWALSIKNDKIRDHVLHHFNTLAPILYSCIMSCAWERHVCIPS